MLKFCYQTPLRGATYLKADVAFAVERSLRVWPDFGHGHCYRVDDAAYSVCSDPDADLYDTRRQIEIIAFPITRFTPRGFRAAVGGFVVAPITRLVRNDATRRFADLTPEAAIASFVARRRKQAQIKRSQAKVADYLADLGDAVLGNERVPE